MADDEPLDDARAVAMTTGAATARVVETLAREGQHAAAQRRAMLERAQDQQRAQQVLAGLDRAMRSSPPGYDSPEQRQARDTDRRAADVPVVARQARATADLMNGRDPAQAAAEGTRTKVRPARTAAVPHKDRGR
jgi:hypothetical protein